MAATKKDNILTVVEHYRTRRKKHNVSGKALLDTQDTEGRIRPASAQRHHKVPLQTSPVTLSVDSSGYIFNASKSNQGAMRREPLTLATHEYAPNVSEVIQRQRYVGDVVSNEEKMMWVALILMELVLRRVGRHQFPASWNRCNACYLLALPKEMNNQRCPSVLNW